MKTALPLHKSVQLRWNDTDFLEFFAVEPTAEDDAVSHNYELERDGLRLLFTLWQLESVIQASLFRGESETELFAFAAYVRGEVRFINDLRGRYIGFEDCIVAPIGSSTFRLAIRSINSDVRSRLRFSLRLT